MMQHARRVSLGVVLLLLTSVGTASAECAWLMWSGLTSKAGTGWEIIDSSDSRAACATLLTTKLKQMSAAGSDVRGNLVFFKNVGDSAMLGRFLCLPDTVDPREPKGK
jgi:hypothetical protein